MGQTVSCVFYKAGRGGPRRLVVENCRLLQQTFEATAHVFIVSNTSQTFIRQRDIRGASLLRNEILSYNMVQSYRVSFPAADL
jgi:hypothetical protein